MFRHSSRPRHAVIDQDGRALDDTQQIGLRRIVFGAWHLAQTDEGREIGEELRHGPRRRLPSVRSQAPVSHLLHDGSPTRVLPVRGARTIVMRVPSAPGSPHPARARDFVRLGFQMAARELDQMVRVLSSGWQKLAAENDRRMQSLDARLARMTARQHEWAAAEDGRALAAAYAVGGTEQVRKLTDEVLAAMDARAKAGTEVAA